MKHLWTDGGWKSRKLWFGFYSTMLLFCGMYLASKEPAVAALYGEFVGGLVGIVTVVLGGNIAGKWVAGDAAKKLGPEVTAEVKVEQPKPAPRASADVD